MTTREHEQGSSDHHRLFTPISESLVARSHCAGDIR
jgi:hypothetical protein